jgi:hypothetical protein
MNKMQSAALLAAIMGSTDHGYPQLPKGESMFYSYDKEGKIRNESWDMEHIINNQGKHNKHPLAEGNTFMGDFIIKCLERRVSKGNIVRRAREFYSYTKEVVEEKYNEMEKKFKEIS